MQNFQIVATCSRSIIYRKKVQHTKEVENDFKFDIDDVEKRLSQYDIDCYVTKVDDVEVDVKVREDIKHTKYIIQKDHRRCQILQTSSISC